MESRKQFELIRVISRDEALNVLELTGNPLPEVFNASAITLLVKANDANSLLNVAEIHAARSRLEYDFNNTSGDSVAKHLSRDLLAVLEKEHDHYLKALDDILAREKQELTMGIGHIDRKETQLFLDNPRYKKDLETLKGSLSALGAEYFPKMRAPNADIVELQKDYGEAFKKAVDDAKAAFDKEPGIWKNLDSALKIMFSILFVIGLVIVLSEKPIDRDRLFFGKPIGEIDIQNTWNEFNMDIFPSSDESAPKRSKK